MKSINRFITLMFCLFVGTSMFLVAGTCAAEDPNYYYYSDKGNDLANYMVYMDLDLQDDDIATLSFSTRYDIEETKDFAMPFITYDPNIIIDLFGFKLNGTQTNWTIEDFNLTPYANSSYPEYIGFYYETNESSTTRDGFYVDNIKITVNGETIFFDDGESGYGNWTFGGFVQVNDTDTTPPVIDNPGDIQIEQDATGSITWVVTEINPDKYWVLRNSTEVNSTDEVVPPSNYKDKAELKVTINTSELGIWNYTISANDTSGNNASNLVKIEVIKKETNNNNNNGGGGGGSSGGGGGTSGEEYKNIEVSETEREYVNKDSKVSYSFDMEGNIISYINFTGKTSSGRIAAKIDTLKDTSTLVDHAPPGKVFKNMGIYVGNLGWASPNNIANPTIRFIVHKSWVNENNIDKSTITLNRYSDGKWNPLETDLIDEDQDSLHFESKTPGFSQFAVTGTEASAAQGGEGEVVEKPTIVVERKEPVTEQTPEEKDTGIPGFSLLTGFTIMLVVVQLLRRKK